MHKNSTVNEINMNLLQAPKPNCRTYSEMDKHREPNYWPLTLSSTLSKPLIRLHFGNIFILCYIT